MVLILIMLGQLKMTKNWIFFLRSEGLKIGSLSSQISHQSSTGNSAIKIKQRPNVNVAHEGEVAQMCYMYLN